MYTNEVSGIDQKWKGQKGLVTDVKSKGAFTVFSPIIVVQGI